MDEVLERPVRRRKRWFEKRPTDQIRPRVITERMKRILLLLYEYRFLRANHIEDLLFAEGYSKQTTNRLLADLYDLGLVDKPEKQKKLRFREGGGSHKVIYALGNEGGKYLENSFGIAQSSARWRDKNRDIEDPNIVHTLLTSEIMMAFERTCALRKDVRLIYPRELLELCPEETRRAREPFAWKVTVTYENNELTVSVKPDFKVFGLEFLTLPAPDNKVWFTLEADTGSETIIPEDIKSVAKTTLFRKYLGYCGTYRQELHRKRFGVVHTFRVLTVTKKEGLQYVRDRASGQVVAHTRIESLQEVARLAGEVCEKINPGFYLFTDLATLVSAPDVLRMPWTTAHPRRKAILDLKPASS